CRAEGVEAVDQGGAPADVRAFDDHRTTHDRERRPHQHRGYEQYRCSDRESCERSDETRSRIDRRIYGSEMEENWIERDPEHATRSFEERIGANRPCDLRCARTCDRGSERETTEEDRNDGRKRERGG